MLFIDEIWSKCTSQDCSARLSVSVGNKDVKWWREVASVLHPELKAFRSRRTKKRDLLVSLPIHLLINHRRLVTFLNESGIKDLKCENGELTWRYAGKSVRLIDFQKDLAKCRCGSSTHVVFALDTPCMVLTITQN